MKNQDLAADYLFRAENRLAALETLMQRKSFADVVRESQEVVELSMKGLLRSLGIEVPRVHDVSEILVQQREILPQLAKLHLKELTRISKSLRRDRELAFYGSEDLTPSQFYQEEDAAKAFADAKWVVSLCLQVMK